MADVTEILNAIEEGDASAAAQLLPLVYDELRQLAAQKMAHEAPGQTLQATALVNEAYLRLVDNGDGRGHSNPAWENRRHFFAAAAEAMRRILVDNARRKKRLKRGGNLERENFDELAFAAPMKSAELLDVHEALQRLTDTHPQAAELVKLRYFLGFSNADTASLLGISARKANQIWAYARVWLLADLSDDKSI